MIFTTPQLDLEDLPVLEAIHAMRVELADQLRTPRRWQGGLRRNALARAIRGSNSIEGIHVEIDDAAAALDGEEPLSADQRTFAEVRGYRQALGYVLAMADDKDFRFDAAVIRGMHFMMLSHDLSKHPGQYRAGPIYVHDDASDRIVYEGPPSEEVPALVEELVVQLTRDDGDDPLVSAAMAHLNLVMIHPFRDGNGRMARALQTMVLCRRGIPEPVFSSIEEWLGSNTEDYYRVLAATGRGRWQPESDPSLWVKFNLRAHHIQGQTIHRRFQEATEIWRSLDEIAAREAIPERSMTELYDATLGFRIRRASYVNRSGIEERTASRDLQRLVEVGLLRPIGQTRGRHYVAGEPLRRLRATASQARPPIEDPYPWMSGRLADLASQAGTDHSTEGAPRP